MKLWELEQMECAEYRDNHGRIWFFHDGNLINDNGIIITHMHSWKELSNLSFEPYVDWENISIDTPIYVRDDESEEWEKRHFASYRDGKIYVFPHGTTSWTQYAKYAINYKYAKLS